MVSGDMRQKIRDYLFSFPNSHVYTVVDGASAVGLLEAINRNTPKYSCLLSGYLGPSLTKVAPYLIKLEKRSAIADWVLDGWGEHYGIFFIIRDTVDFSNIRAHFRGILTVKSPDNKSIYFRYYDPRVMSMYLPTCRVEEMKQVFGPVELLLMEGNEGKSVLCYWPGSNGVQSKEYMYTYPIN